MLAKAESLSAQETICNSPGVTTILDEVTPLILTHNEVPNIDRTNDKLNWARSIVVVDSISTDETRELVNKHPGAVWTERPFDSHANQWNYGLAQIETEWVLSLDADYQLSDELISEIAGLMPDETIAAYYVRFQYCVEGIPLRGSLYPPRAVLFRPSRCHFEQDGHTQILRIDGQSGWLQSFI